MITFSVIIPLHNEEENILPLFSRLAPVMDGLRRPYEIIFVDDGSTDESGKVLQCIEPGRAVSVSLSGRAGQSRALQAGFDLARGEYIITLDADLQNAPEDIPLLLEELDRGSDLVCGWRSPRRDPPEKLAASCVASAIRRMVTRESIHDFGCGLRVFRRALLKDIRLDSGLHRFFTLLAQKKGYRVSEVKIHHSGRLRGRSKYSSRNRLCQATRDFFRVCFSLVLLLGISSCPGRGWAAGAEKAGAGGTDARYRRLIRLYTEYFRLEDEDFAALRFTLAPKQLVLGGSNLKLTLVDDRGRPWMFKPARAENIKAFRETASYRIFTLFGVDTPETHVAHLTLNGHPVSGSLQRYVQTVSGPKQKVTTPVLDLGALAPPGIAYMLKAQVLDWLLQSRDATLSQFIDVSCDAGGKIDGVNRIDHEDKLLTDGFNRMDPEHMICLDTRLWGKPEANAYYKFAAAARSGAFAVGWHSNLPFVAFVQELPDDFFIRLILPTRTGSFDVPDHPAAYEKLKKKQAGFLETFVSLKNNLKENFGKFYDAQETGRNETGAIASGDGVPAQIASVCASLEKRISALKKGRKSRTAAAAGQSDIKARVSFEGFMVARAFLADNKSDQQAFERGYPAVIERLEALEAQATEELEKEALRYYRSLLQKKKAGEYVRISPTEINASALEVHPR